MKDFQEDLITEKLIEFDIEGRVFKLREPLGEEIDFILDKCISILDDGGSTSVKEDLVKRNKLLTQAIVVDAPYSKDGKQFRELDKEQKYHLLNRLKIGIRNQLRKKVLELSGMRKSEENITKK